MDIIALTIGLLIGILIGAVAIGYWSSSKIKANKAANSSTESQLKALLAQQSQDHILASQQSIAKIERELKTMKESVEQYENNLSLTNDDDISTPFFGEHTSMFLRNSKHVPSNTELDQNTDSQPKDFANTGSGVFVGHPAIAEVHKKRKSK